MGLVTVLETGSPGELAFVKSLLDGMELAVSGEALDRGDLHSIGLNSEHRAGLHGLPVHEHRAGAARRRVAAHGRPDEPEPLAEHVHEQLTRFDPELVAYAVGGQRHFSHRPSFSPSTRDETNTAAVFPPRVARERRE